MLITPRIRIVVGDYFRGTPEASPVVARLNSNADNAGFNYFAAVDSGRAGFGPRRAKALRFQSPRGVFHSRLAGVTPSMKKSQGKGNPSGFVFAKRVRGFGGWNLRGRALSFASPEIGSLISEYRGGFSGLAELANRIIVILAWHIVRITPKRTGKLARGYQIISAG